MPPATQRDPRRADRRPASAATRPPVDDPLPLAGKAASRRCLLSMAPPDSSLLPQSPRLGHQPSPSRPRPLHARNCIAPRPTKQGLPFPLSTISGLPSPCAPLQHVLSSTLITDTQYQSMHGSKEVSHACRRYRWQRPRRHLPGSPPRRGRARGQLISPAASGSPISARCLEERRAGGRRPRPAGGGRRLWPARRRPAARHRHRHDLLHPGERHAARRGPARPVQHLLSDGHHLGARPQRPGAHHRGAAAPPFGDYGIQKAAIEAYLLDQTRRYGFPATVVHPGHIVGPGWAPLNPQGISTPASLSRSPAARS